MIFDIGANIGYYSQLFAKLCGKKGFVHCFEPVPETFHMLLKSLVNTTNTKANNIAAGDSNQKMEISFNPEDSEKSTLLADSDSTSSTLMVNVLPLDEYVREIQLKRLDFLKCDVEGFEFKVLKGMKNTLANHLPQISIEITLPIEQRVELIDFLKSLGYNSFRKIEKGFPYYDPQKDKQIEGDYFYLHATSSLSS